MTNLDELNNVEFTREWTPKDRLSMIALLAFRVEDVAITNPSAFMRTSLDCAFLIRRLCSGSAESLEWHREKIFEAAGIKDALL